MMAIRNATEMDARSVSGCLTKAFEPYRRLYTEAGLEIRPDSAK